MDVKLRVGKEVEEDHSQKRGVEADKEEEGVPRETPADNKREGVPVVV